MRYGIMQGRLSPPASHRIQAFPKKWEPEFSQAKELGFYSIEWLFEADDFEQNPIWSELGRAKIQACIQNSGVKVESLCADYFLEKPFFRVSQEEKKKNVEVLKQLIPKAAELGVKTILLPVLEKAEIRTAAEEAELLDALQVPLNMAQAHGMKLGLETELAREAYLNLVCQRPHPALGIYYDIGNAAAKGYSLKDDANLLGLNIIGVHVKDRILHGKTVPLGTGSANFLDFLTMMEPLNTNLLYILQTAFGERFVDDAKKNLGFMKEIEARA